MQIRGVFMHAAMALMVGIAESGGEPLFIGS